MSLEAIEKRLGEIEAREQAATPGPWMACVGSGGIECTGIHSDAAEGVICDFLTDYMLKEQPKKVILHDIKFVESARQDVPALVKALRVSLRYLHEREIKVIASLLESR